MKIKLSSIKIKPRIEIQNTTPLLFFPESPIEMIKGHRAKQGKTVMCWGKGNGERHVQVSENYYKTETRDPISNEEKKMVQELIRRYATTYNRDSNHFKIMKRLRGATQQV